MEQINGHMYFQNVLGSIAPVDPPTIEQTVDCLRYAFRKWWVQRRCFISPSGGMTAWSAIIIHNYETTDGPVPKNSRKWRSSVPASPIALPALCWMFFPPRRKSLSIGFVILFRLFELPLSMWRGGWEEQEQVERGGGWDCQDDWWKEELHAREQEQACSCCLCVCAWYHTLSRKRGWLNALQMSSYNLSFQTVSLFSYVCISTYSLIPGEQGGSSFFYLDFFAASA